MTSSDHVTEIAVRKQEIAPTLLTTDQLKFIAGTEFVPKSMRGNLPAILACVATGRALGLPDMTALRSISIIDGKAAFASELMVARVRERGHSITGTVTGESATVHGRRADNGDEMTCEWTLEMAKRANLLSKSNWKSYPEAMLWARAVSQLCRMLFPDCFAGATYTPEEAEETSVDELMDEPPAGEVVAQEEEPVNPAAEETEDLTGTIAVKIQRLYALYEKLGAKMEAVEPVVLKHRDGLDDEAFAVWLDRQIVKAEEQLEADPA